MATASELGKLLAQKRGELQNLIETKSTPEGLDFNTDEIKAFNDRNEELNRLNDEYVAAKSIEDAARQNADELKALNGLDRKVPFANTNGADVREQAQATKSLGQIFVESQAYKSARENDMRHAKFDVTASSISINDAVKTVFSTSTGYVPYPAQQAGYVPFAVRRPVVADLIPQTDTDAPSIIYMEQTTQTLAADTVAQGAVKPESAFAWTRRTTPMEVIAHTLPITNQALEDVPGIRDIIDQQMTLGVQLAEEDQILNGTGTTPDLMGFMNKTGVQTRALGGDDIFTAAMAAFTLVRFTGFADVTGGIVHPNDWLSVITLKDTTGRFIYGNPQDQGPQRLWGVPIIVTTAMTENTALFGDFNMYSRLWRMHGIRLIVGYVNDDLVRNQQTLVAEERVTLQISRPSAFVKITGI
jgi:HK97 family phage major capsid protein